MYYGIYSTVIGYKRGRQIVNYYFLKENLNTLYMEKLSYCKTNFKVQLIKNLPFQFKKNLKNLPFLKALDNDLNFLISSSIDQYTLALEMMKYKLKADTDYQ